MLQIKASFTHTHIKFVIIIGACDSIPGSSGLQVEESLGNMLNPKFVLACEWVNVACVEWSVDSRVVYECS